MGKRSAFARKERDFYKTPPAAVRPLARALAPLGRFSFAEPCAGDGCLADEIEAITHGECLWRADIEPQREDVTARNFLDMHDDDGLADSDMIITNPPWGWEFLGPCLAAGVAWRKPMWLLLPADFAHNKRSAMTMQRCERIVSVGRVSWEGNGVSGKDNCAWYLFNPFPTPVTVFIARGV